MSEDVVANIMDQFTLFVDGPESKHVPRMCPNDLFEDTYKSLMEQLRQFQAVGRRHMTVLLPLKSPSPANDLQHQLNLRDRLFEQLSSRGYTVRGAAVPIYDGSGYVEDGSKYCGTYMLLDVIIQRENTPDEDIAAGLVTSYDCVEDLISDLDSQVDEIDDGQRQSTGKDE